jgi:protein-disulfide isomerase
MLATEDSTMAQDGTDLIPEPSESDHVRGLLTAPAILTEYGDFECPYCGDAYRVLETIRAKYQERLAIVFRHYPLNMHPHAEAAAEAAEEAAQAGKFWQMYDELFRHQKALTDPDLAAYGEAIGVPGEKIASAVEQRSYRARIERDQRSGDESGVEGTPALYLNGFAYGGDVSAEALEETIERALSAARAR